MPRISHEECELQCSCVRYMKYFYAHLDLAFNHSPNEGERSKFQGAILGKMGMTKGWPDLEIMYAAQGKHGLFVEFKTGTGRQSKEQKEVQQMLEDAGYRYEVIRSVPEFKALCHDYLGPESDPDRELIKVILGMK